MKPEFDYFGNIASLETGVLQWYKMKDIDLSYPNIKDNMY